MGPPGTRACLPIGRDDDGGQNGRRAVREGQFVVAGGQGSPLLEGVEAAFDDVALLVGVLVVGDGTSARGALAFSVGFLIFLFGDDAFNAKAA